MTLIFGLQVNLGKANIVGDMTLPGMVAGPAKIRNPHISVLFRLSEVEFKFKCQQLN